MLVYTTLEKVTMLITMKWPFSLKKTTKPKQKKYNVGLFIITLIISILLSFVQHSSLKSALYHACV